ncbi:hypothetical protein [Sinorhizobium meliloti]|nr:hypothetical protein [Sinorhizobium meliloti]MDW9377920.1 hypothetical protein [Sinorhizobium meliloti]MDW9438612.1 hypothetical protein [Sinorhizobium meliloti]MDW9477970.1 hypothetical protein [Sinorhizobium meliloti]MDW9495843.1 hypothetical protein [Sinorhizobium meliloti]MDW9552864.1 hypothetical protein [Sinorhizobium meliloti]
MIDWRDLTEEAAVDAAVHEHGKDIRSGVMSPFGASGSRFTNTCPCLLD